MRQPRRIGRFTIDWLTVAFVVLFLSTALGMAALALGQHQTVIDVEHLVKEHTAVIERIGRLNQEACERTNKSRVESNVQIRIPLRTLFLTFAELTRQAAREEPNPLERARLVLLAITFEEDGNRVKILKPLPCNFDGPMPK